MWEKHNTKICIQLSFRCELLRHKIGFFTANNTFSLKNLYFFLEMIYLVAGKETGMCWPSPRMAAVGGAQQADASPWAVLCPPRHMSTGWYSRCWLSLYAVVTPWIQKPLAVAKGFTT